MLGNLYGVLGKKKRYYGYLKRKNIPLAKQNIFEELMKNSISLAIGEKVRFIQHVSDPSTSSSLSHKKIDSIIEILTEEVQGYNKMRFTAEEPKINMLINKAATEWETIIVKFLDNDITNKLKIDTSSIPLPSSIAKIMEEYVKGQTKAVVTISTLLYYHRKATLVKNAKHNLTQNPVLIAGPTGTGKSYMLEVGCSILNVPYLHVDCSSLVSTGIIGHTIDDMLKMLIIKNDYNVEKTEKSVILLDEIDKLLTHHDGESILFQLLRLVEGTTIPIDHYRAEGKMKEIHSISTKRILFIFAGSFQKFMRENVDLESPEKNYNLLETGLPLELLGRINKIVVLNKLSKASMRKILLENKFSPLEEIKTMLAMNDCEPLAISNDTIDNIIDEAIKSPFGARGLKQAIWNHFEPILYKYPDNAYDKSNKLERFHLQLNRNYNSKKQTAIRRRNIKHISVRICRNSDQI